MKGLLVRVGADLTAGGGRWNGPVDTQSYRYELWGGTGGLVPENPPG